MGYKNTLQKGSARFIIFREGEDWYGVCLEFNIVESGSSPQEVFLLLNEAFCGYLEAAKKTKARPHILNQKADDEYEKMWQANQEGQKIKDKEIYSTGMLNIFRGATAAVC